MVEEKSAQSPVREDQDRLRLALSTTPMFVWEWDLATNRVEPLHDNLGLWDDCGGDICRWIHAEDLARVQEASARIAAGETLGATDFRLVMSAGEERWCSFRAQRRGGAEGQPTRLCGVTLDITEQMLAVKAAADEASRAKDEFLAMLSHELRTPLTPARALVQMLERDESLAPEHRAVVAEVAMHIGSEVRLIEDLLAFERVVRDLVQLQLTTVDVHEQVRHALAVCAPLIRLKRLVVIESLSAAHPVVLGDALRLRQVMWNLVQNAVKFTPYEGTISVRSANPEPGEIVIEVEDTGFGIKPGMLQKIFEGFERGGRRPDSLGGLGLGLAISRRLVELHGGKLTAASPGIGRGATFTLRLATSAARPAGEPQAAESAALPAATPPGAARPLEILFVEDHPPSARAIARLLRTHGHTVQVVNGLVAAERAVAAGRFDLLLCDLQLPEGSSLDFLPRIRHHLRRWAAGGAEAPAIALSGFARESDVARSLAAGYVEHLAKPVDQDHLLDAIRRATTRPDPNEQA
jgi:signal transduction histidine kinase/ActR/RegA family two-component response regulator